MIQRPSSKARMPSHEHGEQILKVCLWGKCGEAGEDYVLVYAPSRRAVCRPFSRSLEMRHVNHSSVKCLPLSLSLPSLLKTPRSFYSPDFALLVDF